MVTKEMTGRTVGDYLHCLDCDETFDYWKYDSLADTGHNGHTLRALTGEEFRAAALDCAEDGCEASEDE
jgi:hypothetical protein